MKIRLLSIAFALLVGSSAVPAQESAAQRHAMATNQLKRLNAEISEGCLRHIRTWEVWKKQGPEIQRQLREMLGLDPLPARTPLKAQITGRLTRPDYQIEKIVF